MTRDVKGCPDVCIVPKGTEVMNPIQYTYTTTHLCTCQHQEVLTNGSTCEVCMGMVVNPSGQEFKTQEAGDEMYDEAYFEALENFYENITFAA